MEEDAWRAQGLHDRLAAPDRDTLFVFEDVSKPYDWPPFAESTSPSSHISSDTAELAGDAAARPTGEALDLLLTNLLPAEAVPVEAGRGSARGKAPRGKAPRKGGSGKISAAVPRVPPHLAHNAHVLSLFQPCCVLAAQAPPAAHSLDTAQVVHVAVCQSTCAGAYRTQTRRAEVSAVVPLL